MPIKQLDGVMAQAGVTQGAFQGIHPRPDGLEPGAVGALSRASGGAMSEQDAVQRMLQKGGAKPTATEYMLQQVIFVVPASERSATLGKRKREAEAMRARFTGCETHAAIRQGPDRRDGAGPRPRCWRRNCRRTGPTRSRTPRPAAPPPCARPSAASSSSASARAREVSDDRVAQMVFQSEGDNDKKADELSKKYIAELREKAQHRRALTRASLSPRRRKRLHPRPLALTSGDPSGVGPEIAIAAWLAARRTGVPPFYLLGDPA